MAGWRPKTSSNRGSKAGVFLRILQRQWFKYSGTPPHIFHLKLSRIWNTCSGFWLSKLSQQTKTFSKLEIKLTILPQLMSVDVFIIISKHSAWLESEAVYEKDAIKNLAKFT